MNHGGSYIDYLDRLKNKKSTINPINTKGNICFQYALTVALNHEEIGMHAEQITKIKHFINKYKWKRLNFLNFFEISIFVKLVLIIFVIAQTFVFF